MDQELIDEILEELSSAMERVETQSAAALEFLKEKGMAKQEDLAPYLERAGNASSVRWQATRVRLSRLLSSIEKREQAKQPPQTIEEPKQAGQEKKQEQAETKSESQETKSANESPKPAQEDRTRESVKASDDSKKQQKEERNEPAQKISDEKPDQQESSEPNQQEHDKPKPADPSRAA